MKIKIIKRTESEKVKESFSTTEGEPSNRNAQKAMTATVKLWIEDFRQKRENEKISVRKLFKEQYCA